MRSKFEKKIIWISDFPLRGSSFGTVTYELLTRMPEYKFEVLSLGYSGVPLKIGENIRVFQLDKDTQIRYYFKKFDPDVTVIFHSFWFLDSMKGELALLKGKRILYIPCEGEEIPYEYRSLFSQFDQVITPSEYSRRVLKKAGIKASVVPHGVDLNFFSPEEKQWHEFRFGYLGMNDIRKQIPRVMEAYSRLRQGILTIATENHGHYDLMSLAKRLGISPVFIEQKLHGLPLSREGVRDYLRSLDVYISPGTEAFGLPALEAQACGVPVIACYDKETECLTENGWKRFKDISLNERVMTLENGEMKWRFPIRKFEYDYTGYLYRQKDRLVDLRVTLNHKMWVGTRKNNWKFETALSILGKRRKYLKTGKWKGKQLKKIIVNGEEKHIKDYLKFMAFYLSRGYFEQKPINGNYTVGLCETRSEQIRNEMKEILSKFTNRKVFENKHQLRVHSKWLWEYVKQFGKSTERFLPKEIKELNPPLLRYFLRNFGKRDRNHSNPTQSRILYTSSKQLADDLQEIAIKAGFASNISIREPQTSFIKGRKIQSKERYLVHLNSRSRVHLVNKTKKTDSLEFYSGKVYCLEVPSHILLVRRNGKAIFCGNSEHGASREVLGNGALYVKVNEYLETSVGKVGLVSVADLYRKMRFLIQVRQAWEKTREKGLKNAQKWSWERAVERMREEIEK